MLTDEDREALGRAITTADTIVFVAPGGATERAIEQIVARHVAAALNEAADDLRAQAAPAWGGDASWLTTGTRVAELAAGWVEEFAEDRAAAPPP